MNAFPTIVPNPMPTPAPPTSERVVWKFRPYGDGTGYWVRTIVR